MTRPDHVPAHLVIEYDVFGSKQIRDIKAEAVQWRAEKGPVVWSDHHGGHWVVLDAELVRQGLTDVATFDKPKRLRSAEFGSIPPRASIPWPKHRVN